MTNSALQATFTSAVTALQTVSEDDLQQLSLLDSAVVLNALPAMEVLTGPRARIARRLQGQLSLSWIESGDTLVVFSVMTALWNYNQTYITGEQLVCAVQRLVRSEVAPGGPYYSDETIVIPANIQIAIFVRLTANPLPNLNTFLANVITTKRFNDSRLTRFALLYLLAKADKSPELMNYTASHWQQRRWQTPLRQAIALSTLQNRASSRTIRQGLSTLCEQQQERGFWNGESLEKDSLAGANAHIVTTALIVEVFAEYWSSQGGTLSSGLQQNHQIVARAAQQMFMTCTEPLRTTALTVVDQVCAADKNFEITLLPRFFNDALETPVSLSNQRYTTLGLANLYLWIAYTIYDDFLDDEAKPASLPVANIAMRTSLDCFRMALPEQSTFRQYVAKVFAGMDEANAWEIGQCRFMIENQKIVIPWLPRYGKGTVLATRSYAHALTPMAILTQHATCGIKQRRCIEAAFRHYLIARQLNDDMHDWRDDVQAGQASYVVTAILRDMHVKSGIFVLETLLPTMQKRFRCTTMPKLSHRMLRHLDLSRQKFAESQLLLPTNDIYTLIDSLELSVRHSLDVYEKSQAMQAVMRLR